MFTGIVEEVGLIEAVEDVSEGKRMVVSAKDVLADAKIGESISVSGACLTVIEFDKSSFALEATKETLRRTTLGNLKKGSKVNLEKAMRLSDRLGGHLVSGHVDCIGKVEEIKEEGFSKVFKFSLPAKWRSYFVEKGSVTVEGVSLTVVDVLSSVDNAKNEENFAFTVALIPHTLEVTTLGSLSVGDSVNIETDVIARYVVRLLGESYLPNLNKDMESELFQGNQV